MAMGLCCIVQAIRFLIGMAKIQWLFIVNDLITETTSIDINIINIK